MSCSFKNTRAALVGLIAISMCILIFKEFSAIHSYSKNYKSFFVKPTKTISITMAVTNEQNEIEYYKSVKNGSLLKLDCRNCALITSAGQLKNTSLGSKIDAYECVIRTNNSPTSKYREDVGIKTTLRVIGHPSRTAAFNNIDNKEIHESERNGAIIVGWGPIMQIGPNKPFSKLLRQMQKKYPSMQIYELGSDGIDVIDQLYKNLTGIDRYASGTWLSTGFFTMVLSRKICDNLDVYGMVDEHYCDRLSASEGTIKDKPYHYYGDGKLGECQHVISTKNSKHGHRFSIEKRVFKNWADEYKNISFKCPMWN